jgi:peptidoglycan/LPS O-acetylase OafA/YrhL
VVHTRLDSLTGLRWFAALAVFGFHALPLLHAVPGANLNGTYAAAASGVSFFFILSGFVLAWNWVPGGSAVPFWRNRFARIWPLHAVTWLAATFILAPAFLRLANVTALVSAPHLLALAFGQAWVPSQHWYFAGNVVAWSLSCEAFFYLCFPLVVAVVMRSRRPWTLLAAAVAAAFAVAGIGSLLSFSLGQWWGYYFPPARLPEFVAGVVLARLVRDGRWPNVPVIPVLALGVASVFAARWLPWSLLYAAGTMIPLAAVVASVAVADRRAGPGLLGSRVLVRLGEISFAFYLVHQLVIKQLLTPLHLKGVEGGRDTALAAGLLLASVVIAWALNVVVERPAQRWLRAPARVRDPHDLPLSASAAEATAPAG